MNHYFTSAGVTSFVEKSLVYAQNFFIVQSLLTRSASGLVHEIATLSKKVTQNLRHLQADAGNYRATLYVDGTNGSKSGDGSQEHPFKTIQQAVNAIPRNLGYHNVLGGSYTIQLADGTYTEQVRIYGIRGGEVIIQGSSKDNVTLIGNVGIVDCACVSIRYMSFLARGFAVNASHSAYCDVDTVDITKDPNYSGNTDGVECASGSIMAVTRVRFYNLRYAASVSNNSFFISYYILNGSGNTVGIQNTGSIVLLQTGIQAGMATTQYANTYGGVMFNGGALIQ